MEGTSHQKPKFLFVVKDPSSKKLTRSEEEEHWNILSHVQTRRQNRHRKTQNNQTQDEPWTNQTSLMTVKPQRQKSKKISQLEKEKGNQSPRIPILSLLQAYPDNNAIDPFNITCVGIDAGTHAMLKYAFSDFARNAFLAEAFAPLEIIEHRMWTRHDKAMNQRLINAVGDEMLMYSTLAYGSSCAARSSFFKNNGKPPEYFMAHASQAIRVRLSEAEQLADSKLLLSIYSLAVTELWNGIPELWQDSPARAQMPDRHCFNACRTHLHAMNDLVTSLGGWNRVDRYVLESMALCNKFLAIAEMGPLAISPTWDPGSPPVTLRNNLLQHDTIPHLGQSLLRTPMDMDLKIVIMDTVEYTRIANCAWKSSEISSSDEGWLFLRLQALICRLHSLTTFTKLDNCIRISAMIFLLAGTQYWGSMLSATKFAMQLRYAMDDSDRYAEYQDHDLLLWCFATASMAGGEHAYWFYDRLVELGREMDFELDKKRMQKRLEPYLFLPIKQQLPLSEVVDEISKLAF